MASSVDVHLLSSLHREHGPSYCNLKRDVPTCFERSHLAYVKFLSRELMALNLLPSIAALASLKELKASAQHHELTADFAIASPLSLRKSAIVFKSGIRRPVSQTNSMLRWQQTEAALRIEALCAQSKKMADGARLVCDF